MNSKAVNEIIETQDLTLSLDDIKFSRLRIRHELDPNRLNQLAQSMEHIGQLQRIGVFRVDQGYELIFGERRLCAAKKLSWKTIKATAFKVDQDHKDLILSILSAENLQTEKLKTIENIEIIRKFKERGFSNSIISEVLFQSLDWVKDHEFVMKDSLARSIAESGSLLDAASLRDFMGFPPSIRNMLMETA